jgi:dolichol-phosphate mannosyltransferase
MFFAGALIFGGRTVSGDAAAEMTMRAAAGQRTPALSVVVPCFNEMDNLPLLHKELTKACRSLVGHYEIIFVNDGSSDRSWALMQELAKADDCLVAIDLSRNFGHQLALSAGLSLSRGARILIMDADLQDPPDLLPEMMRLIDDGADVVYGQRIARPGETAFKKLSARVFYRALSKLSDIPIPLDSGDFRLLRREVLDVLLSMPEQYRFIRGMVAWAGFKQVALPYERRPRATGTSHYSLWRMVHFAADAITGFSIAPLRIALVLSAIFLFVSMITFIYAIYSYVFLKVVAGWTSLTVLISLFSAIQLFCMGVIGEYVGRIFVETKRRPLFVIREVCSREDKPARA